jgi:hypothetical protein
MEMGVINATDFLVEKPCLTHTFLIYKLFNSSFKIFKKVKVLQW